MTQQQPPTLARHLFEWYCGQAKADDLLGDIDELFFHHLKTKSLFQARLLYWKNVISLITSYAIRKRKRDARIGQFASSLFSPAMLQSYVKVAARNLYQHKYFSLLNAFGLAVGMSISLLLLSMYSYISTSDNFHVNRENIYSITSTRTEGIEQQDLASTPIALGEKLKEDFSGVKEVVRIHSSFAGEVVFDKENIPLKGYYADANFLNVFTFPLRSGNPYTALSKPNTIILTETSTRKLFASTDVLGKIIELKGVGSFEITGVMKDYPKNTHFRFEALVSYATLPESFIAVSDQWTNFRDQYVYVLLEADSDPTQFQRYLNESTQNIYRQLPVRVNFQIKPLEDIITTDNSNSIGPQWGFSGFIVFGVLALFILLPACFNYVNISMARALKRSKEIGLRKTMGGAKNQIFFQFITETVVITLIALMGALFIFILIRAEFQSMLVEASTLDLSLTPKMCILFIIFGLLTGLSAGTFPALYFAGLNPVQALKSMSSGKVLRGMSIRKGLTVFQFMLSFCFILSLIVFGRQYHTILNFDFGFQKENIVNVSLQNTKPELAKATFAKLSMVQSVSLSSGAPGLSTLRTWVQTPDNDSIEAAQLFVDADFIQNFKFELLHGNNFPTLATGDERYLLVNEQLLISNKITPAEALGKTFLVDGKEMQILGVLKNFHYAPPHLPIGNFIFRMNPEYFTQANLLVNNPSPYELFSALEKSWKILNDREPLQAMFFEDELIESYIVYRYLLKIAGFLGLLAISISVLGLLGMVVYTSETRVKEVSIRKVLGASALGITMLLSKDYLKLLMWAILLGIPMAIFIYQTVFTRIPDYHASITHTDILLGACILIILGFITIASQTYKTALSNPAETLKSE
jgi:ABC-type antimicrobial peptide transport system permease subunit